MVLVLSGTNNFTTLLCLGRGREAVPPGLPHLPSHGTRSPERGARGAGHGHRKFWPCHREWRPGGHLRTATPAGPSEWSVKAEPPLCFELTGAWFCSFLFQLPSIIDITQSCFRPTQRGVWTTTHLTKRPPIRGLRSTHLTPHSATMGWAALPALLRLLPP